MYTLPSGASNSFIGSRDSALMISRVKLPTFMIPGQRSDCFDLWIASIRFDSILNIFGGGGWTKDQAIIGQLDWANSRKVRAVTTLRLDATAVIRSSGRQETERSTPRLAHVNSQGGSKSQILSILIQRSTVQSIESGRLKNTFMATKTTVYR